MIDGCHDSVIIDLDSIQHVGVGSTGSDGLQILFDGRDRFRHAFIRVHGDEIHLFGSEECRVGTDVLPVAKEECRSGDKGSSSCCCCCAASQDQDQANKRGGAHRVHYPHHHGRIGRQQEQLAVNSIGRRELSDG